MNPLIPPSGFEFQQAQRVLIDELNNAVAAHHSLYTGNPGQWDAESAWGALQTIAAELAMQYCRKLQGHPPLTVPTCQRYAFDASKLFILWQVDHPLVKAGATTNHDAQAFAKVLTTYITYLVQTVRHPEPRKMFDKWHQAVKHV